MVSLDEIAIIFLFFSNKNKALYIIEHLIMHRDIFEYQNEKNNQNIKRVELISEIFTHSKILIPFREPIQHAYSLLTQHKKFINDSKNDKFISNYMKWIGHTEFGPNYIPIYNQNLNFQNDLEINHWIEQWYLTYSDSIQSLKNKKNVHLISYEKLCTNKNYWFQIQKLVSIEKPYDFQFKESKKFRVDNKSLIQPKKKKNKKVN